MAIEGTPEYQPNLAQKTTSWVSKRAPDVLGKILQFLLYWTWKGAQFVIEMFHDAINR